MVGDKVFRHTHHEQGMMKMNGLDVPRVFYYRPDVIIVLLGNTHEC
jgi:hypothetical protein